MEATYSAVLDPLAGDPSGYAAAKSAILGEFALRCIRAIEAGV